MALFVLIHGGWSASWVWEKNVRGLEDAGHQVICYDMPGHGGNRSVPLERVNLADHVAGLKALLATLREPAILVAHSMTGMVISQAAEDMPEKVSKLVYLAAFMPDAEGAPMMKYILEDPWTQVSPATTVTLENGLTDFNRAYLRNVGFNTCDDATFAWASSRLQLENGALWSEPVHLTERYEAIPKYYIHTLKDNCCSYYMQRLLVRFHPCVAEYYLDTDHFGMLADPEGANRILLAIAEDRRGLS